MKRSLVTAAALLFAGIVGTADAQTTTPPPTGFETLSPGNQKIANALYEAQTPSSKAPLTRDQIATMKQSGQGWGEVFHTMQTQGLVSAKNLGQVVSQYNHVHHLTSTPATITTAGGRTETVETGTGASVHGHADQDAAGSSHGSAVHGDGGSQGGSGGMHGGGHAR